MDIHGVVLLHGYGVRGGIWNTVRDSLEGRLGPVAAPDMNATNRDDLQTQAITAITDFTTQTGGPALVVGHSLGAVLAALAANRLGPTAVSGALLIAPPFGHRDNVPGPVLRFLLKTRLLPPALVRPRFFSSHTPIGIQKRVFKDSVPERGDLQQLTFERTWFHTHLLTRPLPVPARVIASEADQIVPADQSRALAESIAAEFELFTADRGVGHDDFFASPAIAAKTAERMLAFATADR